MAMVPDEQGIFYVLIVSGGGQGSGFFLYNGTPGLGTLVAQVVAPGTTQDPYGNTVVPVMNLGTWSAGGSLLQHFGIDVSGRAFIVGPDGVIRIQINNGSFGTGPDIRFFNDFGAVILVVDPSRGGTFQYQDNNSAVQGPLIGYSGGKNATDPVNGTAVTAGVNLIDPVFGDSITIVGANIIMSQGPFTKNTSDTANTGATNQGPFRHIAGPEQTQAGHAVQRWYGTSPDGTRAAGTVISLTDPPTRQTAELLEIQGTAVATFLKAFAPGSTSTEETWHSMTAGLVAGFGAGATTPRYQLEPDNGGRVRLSGIVALTANQVAGTVFFTLPAAYRPLSNKFLLARSNFGGGQACLVDVQAGGNMLIQTNGSNGQVFGFDALTYELD